MSTLSRLVHNSEFRSPDFERFLYEQSLPHCLDGAFILARPLLRLNPLFLGLFVGHAKVDLLRFRRGGRRLVSSHLLEIEDQLVELFQPEQDLLLGERLLAVAVRSSRAARSLEQVGDGRGGRRLQVLGRGGYSKRGAGCGSR